MARPGVLETLPRYIRNSFVAKTLAAIFAAIFRFLFRRSHFITKHLLGNPPDVPQVTVTDARCNRVRIVAVTKATSIFNEDHYQASLRRQRNEDAWADQPWTSQNSTILAGLEPATTYIVRARSKNAKGMSEWGPVRCVETLHRPRDGGYTCWGYTWTQDGTEITIACALPTHLRSKQITVNLRPQSLRVAVQDGEALRVLMDGELFGRVRLLSPEGSSYWEMEREDEKCILRVVLEKERAATNIRWGFWRAAFLGHPEVDTHAIESDPHVKNAQILDDGASPDLCTCLAQESQSLRHRASIKAAELEDIPDSLKAVYAQ